MKRSFRLRGRRDFQSLLSGRRVYSGPGLLGFAREGAGPNSRIGVAVSRQVKGSVARNRARRRLREAARLGLLGEDSPLRRAGITLDVVLIARPQALVMSFELLRLETATLSERLLTGR